MSVEKSCKKNAFSMYIVTCLRFYENNKVYMAKTILDWDCIYIHFISVCVLYCIYSGSSHLNTARALLTVKDVLESLSHLPAHRDVSLCGINGASYSK